jgi:glyoxylase-like metal-dependent hydrolase (beta-lactamase superfamily II)
VPNDLTDLAYQSWQKIRAKGASIVYPGHGPAWRL